MLILEKMVRNQIESICIGDSRLDWPKAPPFDAIIVTAALSVVPQALINQLKIRAASR